MKNGKGGPEGGPGWSLQKRSLNDLFGLIWTDFVKKCSKTLKIIKNDQNRQKNKKKH